MKAVGDFIVRVKELGAIAITVGSVAVRFGDPLAPARQRQPQTAEEKRELQEWSA